MLYQCSAVFPGPAGSFPSVALVRGYYGVRTMRPGVWWVLSRSTLIQSGRAVESRRVTLAGRPIGAEASPLLEEFGRPGSFEVRRRVVQGVTVQDELGPRPMGKAGEVDVVLGEMVTHIPVDAAERDGVTMAVRAPAEELCFDVLLHEGATTLTPEATCFTMVNTEFPYQDPERRDELPLTEELADLGSAAGMACVPDVPEHASLLERLVAATGSRAEDFRAYRLRMRFPPLPICLVVTYGVAKA
jgi:hypothetical protein